ncbi:tetratricopeptide repeat protein [Phycisphaerales bacterium AB-hyl4]|uniref:Tetratricopeptide repeat protein n=1 Tax=Natronomicrosphaera hydrolytica TaxID=3242702 RepID=A0ABV4U5U2_9BACT
MSEWSDAERHAQRAQQFYETGQWSKALEELRQALTYNPFQSEWHFGLGLTLEALQRYDEAVRAYQQTLDLRGDDMDALLHLGIVLVRCGHPRQAIQTFERAQRLDREIEACYCHRIHAYSQLGEHDNAETMFYLARQLTDECPTCYDGLAHSLAARRENERAIWCWQQALRLDPAYPDVHANLATAHWRLGRLERARQDFIRQLRQRPRDTRAMLDLGRLLMELDRDAEAGEKFRRVLEIDPAAADAYYHLGELALLAGHLDAAEARFIQTRRLDPTRPGVQLGLARVARERGQLERARVFARVETQRAGQSPQQVLELARQLIDLGMPDTAVELLHTTIQGRSTTQLDTAALLGAAWALRGTAEFARGRPRAGMFACRRGLRFAPANIAAMHRLIEAHLAARELRRARVWLRRARHYAPGNPVTRRLTFRLWWRRLTGA